MHVALVKDSFKPGIKVAPQNCNFTGCGAYTGEMSVDQIKDMGMSTVLIGHSERRGEFGLPTPKESNELMATKLQYILDQGLSCVFCIGEPLPIREKGVDAVLAELDDGDGTISLTSFSRWMMRTYTSYVKDPSLIQDSVSKWPDIVYNQ